MGKIDSVRALRKQPETLTDGQSGGTMAERSNEAQQALGFRCCHGINLDDGKPCELP